VLIESGHSSNCNLEKIITLKKQLIRLGSANSALQPHIRVILQSLEASQRYAGRDFTREAPLKGVLQKLEGMGYSWYQEGLIVEIQNVDDWEEVLVYGNIVPKRGVEGEYLVAITAGRSPYIAKSPATDAEGRDELGRDAKAIDRELTTFFKRLPAFDLVSPADVEKAVDQWKNPPKFSFTNADIFEAVNDYLRRSGGKVGQAGVTTSNGFVEGSYQISYASDLRTELSDARQDKAEVRA